MKGEESIRLSKAIAEAGVASRRKAEELIFRGLVKVNGKVALLPQTLVSFSKDLIQVQNHSLTREKKVYYLLNKPKGYICTHNRPASKKIVYDLFPTHEQRLFTVGRLDRETTGLLLLTNDGHFAQRLIHPSNRIKKEYLVKVKNFIEDSHVQCIFAGGRIEGQWVKPMSVKKVRRGSLKIVVREGKKREIRTLIEKAGLELIELKRIRIGGLTLGKLAEGEYRSLSEKEKELLLSS